jgi:putative transposase
MIEVGTRRVRIVGVTPIPDGRWVAQQARNLSVEGRLDNAGFLIRDRDAKFTSAFDEVFRTEDARVILTPIRALKANAFAERFVRTVRNEVLDLTLVTGRRHLVRLLAEYEAHYNSHRPNRGLALEAPAGRDAECSPIPIHDPLEGRARWVHQRVSRAGGIAWSRVSDPFRFSLPIRRMSS